MAASKEEVTLDQVAVILEHKAYFVLTGLTLAQRHALHPELERRGWLFKSVFHWPTGDLEQSVSKWRCGHCRRFTENMHLNIPRCSMTDRLADPDDPWGGYACDEYSGILCEHCHYVTPAHDNVRQRWCSHEMLSLR